MNRLKRAEIVDKAGDLWCRMMHNAAMWPIHGFYECRSCGRRHPITWAGEQSQSNNSIRVSSSSTTVLLEKPSMS